MWKKAKHEKKIKQTNKQNDRINRWWTDIKLLITNSNVGFQVTNSNIFECVYLVQNVKKLEVRNFFKVRCHTPCLSIKYLIFEDGDLPEISRCREIRSHIKLKIHKGIRGHLRSKDIVVLILLISTETSDHFVCFPKFSH